MTKKKNSSERKAAIYFKKWSSPVCDLYLYASDEALVALVYNPLRGDFIKQSNLIIDKTIRQLQEYFRGQRRQFSIPLAPRGTEFQMKAWSALRKIPYGKTMSYREQAEEIGADKAFRAVGTANGKNPISILVPCHRVISSTGKISGYAGGPTVKSQLLKIEGLNL